MIFNPYLPPSADQIRHWSKEAERRIAAGEPLDGIPFAVIGTVDDRQFSHNSVDLTLGRYINQPVQGGYKTVDLHDGPYHMVPGDFCLPITNEIIYCGMWPQLGIGWQAQIFDTSTHARRGGSSHAHAGYGDVGFCNHLTLEERPVLPLALHLGMVACQIAFQPVNLGSVYPTQGNIYQERTGIAPIPKPHKIYLPK
jgi:deoxycytidine triphosphate deaminase